LSHDDGQPDGRWERRKRFLIDIFGQDGLENLLSELVRLDFALLSTLYGAGFLRHTNLLRAENVKHHDRLSKHVRLDWLRTDSHRQRFLFSHLTYVLQWIATFCDYPLHVVLNLRGQGSEIALAAVIDNNDEPM
jgi:hypothetical protein